MENEFNSAAEAAFSDPDVAALLRSEPGTFGDSDPQPEPGDSPTPESEAEQPVPSSPEVAGPAEAPAPAASYDPELEQLKGFYRGLQAVPQQPQQQQPTAPQLPGYAYDINDNMLRAVTSEDMRERAAALQAFAVNLSQTVHQRAVQQVREEIAQVLPQYVQQTALQEYQRREIARDFYGKYPELDRPEVAPVVAQIAQQVMTESRANGWTPKVRDDVATRVRSLLGAVANPVQQRPAPQMAAPSAQPINANPGPGRNILRELGLE
jgi:hypothetical protein